MRDKPEQAPLTTTLALSVVRGEKYRLAFGMAGHAGDFTSLENLNVFILGYTRHTMK